jgi:hypothetical protein
MPVCVAACAEVATVWSSDGSIAAPLEGVAASPSLTLAAPAVNVQRALWQLVFTPSDGAPRNATVRVQVQCGNLVSNVTEIVVMVAPAPIVFNGIMNTSTTEGAQAAVPLAFSAGGPFPPHVLLAVSGSRADGIGDQDPI